MKLVRVFVLFLTGTALLLPLAASKPVPEGLVLVRIGFASFGLIPPDLRPGLTAVAKLSDAWLAVWPAETAGLLAEAGADLEIVDSQPTGKAYFLVRVRGRGDGPALERLGRAVRLDAATALFWSVDREAREILPAGLAIARLCLETAIPLSPEGESAAVFPALPVRIADPAIVPWVSRVSTERLAAAVGDLEGFQTRYVSTEGCASAGAYLFEAFRSFGLQVENDPFTLGGVTTNNIVATLPGRAEPNLQVVVCAHYDSASDQRWTLAPGADDDGSGTAAVLEIARILAGADFDLTIKFICFSGEEWGQYGSRHYVAEAQAAGETILGVINLDMIAYTDRRPWALTVIHNEPSTDLARRFAAAAAEYAGLAVKTMAVSSFPYGDHAPFWDAGFVALCATETATEGNPYIHTAADRLGTLTMDYARQGVQACLAAAAELARPAVVPAAPTGIVVRSQIGRSLYLRVKTVELRWDASKDPVSGYHIYRSTASGGPYQRLSSAPQAGLQFTDRFLKAETVYYYVLSAVDAQGRESRPSIEVADTEGAGNGRLGSSTAQRRGRLDRGGWDVGAVSSIRF